MALIETVKPGAAQGKIREFYAAFEKQTGMIPGPLKLTSASPGLFDLYTGGMSYWTSHATLSLEVLACIRYLVARNRGFQACIEYNGGLLRARGLTDEALDALLADPMTAPVEDRERELIAFVIAAITDPASATQAGVDALHQLGWTDHDILDATYHGAALTAMGLLLDIFGPVG